MRRLQVPVRLWSAALWCTLQLGCYAEATTNRIDALQELVAFQGRQLHRLEQELNDAMTLALCSPELRQLMEDVQKECSPQSTVATGQAPAGVLKRNGLAGPFFFLGGRGRSGLHLDEYDWVPGSLPSRRRFQVWVTKWWMPRWQPVACCVSTSTGPRVSRWKIASL